jgi:hypothetical protein
MEDIKGMRRRVFNILLSCIGLVLGSTGLAWSSEPAELAVTPTVMNVDTFFSGGRVTISGEIPSADDVLIEILGPEASGLFDMKGRVGPFWMTREKVRLENAPQLYMLLLPQGPDWELMAARLGLGVEQLKKKIAISGSALPTDDIFRMFVSLKSSEGLYDEAPGAVLYAPAPNGRRSFTATYMLPSSTTAGRYTIKATTIENGVRGPEKSKEVTVQEVGFVKMVKDLASSRPLTYGISAVLIALLAGSLMGVIFKRGGSH